MGISIFYFIALVPVLIGGVLMLFNRRIVWWEWLGGCAAGFLVSAIMHIIAYTGMTHDTETWSGTGSQVVRYPYWMEHYTYTTTDSKGNTTTHDVWIPHPEHWTVKSTLGELELEQQDFEQVKQRFGGLVEAKWTYKSNFYSGDHNVYVTNNTAGFVQPVVDDRSWTNKVKAAPSVFSFKKVPPSVKVYPWPSTGSHIRSERVMGLRGDIDALEWDRFNARLGPNKHVNVVLIGFGTEKPDIAEWQRAAWLGGKKNDLVICFGGNPNQPAWARVFGWTESDITKRNLETLILERGVSREALPAWEAEIRSTFKAKDWSKFDYLTIEPPLWAYVTLFAVMIVSQIAWWWWASENEYVK